jgi:hypothetical protein
VGIHPRDINQLQDNMSRHGDPRLVIEPGLNPDFQGIGQELGAVFPAQVFANLPEAFGQFRLILTTRVVPDHEVSSDVTG